MVFKAARTLALPLHMMQRLKHIAIKCHLFHEKVDYGEIHFARVDSSDQKADICMKGMVWVKFEAL